VTPERRAFFLRAAPPLLVGAVIALLPVPEGLKPQAWCYFALFAAVIVGVATEPRTEFWILGFVVGAVFLGTYLLIGVPWLVWRSF
jgi:di/tricarboxylate transporter